MATVYQERAVDATTTTTTTVDPRTTQRHHRQNDFSEDEEVVLELSNNNAQQGSSRYSDADSIGSRSSARRRSKREAVKEKRKEDKERKARDKADKEERKRVKKSTGSAQQQQQVPRSVEYEAETVVHTRIPDQHIDDDDDQLNSSAVIVDAGNNTRRLVPSNYHNAESRGASVNTVNTNNNYTEGYSTATLGSSGSYRLDDATNSQQQLNDTSYSRGSYTMNGITSPPQRHPYRNGGDMPIPVHIERTTQQQTTTTTGYVPITGSATIARMGPTNSHLLATGLPASSTATPEPTAQQVGTLKRQQPTVSVFAREITSGQVNELRY